MKQPADRNLLFGILALQLDFITREQLIAAMHAWVLEKSKALGTILVSQGGLDDENCALLESLVKKHLAKHENDPEKSLAAISTVESVRTSLGQVADADVEASLQLISVARDVDPNRTVIGETPHGSDDPYETFTGSSRTSVETGTRYRVVRPHAKGGLGVVSVAFDEELKREVALKEIHLRYAHDEISRSRFLLEAEITGRLEHPGIVPVYGLGNYADGRPYYAMRFIRGDSLKEAISAYHGAPQGGGQAGTAEADRNVEFRKLLTRFIDICNAMEYAHSRGILHRDLKPANVMLGKFGETLVVDWGLAKPMGQPESGTHPEHSMLVPASGSSSSTLPGSAIGTPQYMSPEQASGRLDQLGGASDIYSLGATLYHLLTGRAPMEGPNLSTIIERVKSGEFARPRAVAPSVPIPLEAVCLKAMALRTEDRYTSARALADDIEHWLADEPVTALPETRRQRIARWLRRHRAWTQAAALFLVLVTVVSVVAAGVVEAARKREQAAYAQSVKMFAEARESIDTWQGGVNNVLRLYPNLALVRERLLNQAAENYVRLAQETNHTPELRLESAYAYLRLGRVRRELSQFESAKDAFVAAEKILKELQERNERPEQRLALAQARGELGAVNNFLGQDGQAGDAFQQALDDLQPLLEKSPESPEYRRRKAAALIDWALLLEKRGHLAEAEQQAQEAVTVYADLARHNGDAKSLSELAASRTTLAQILRESGRTADALALLEQAIAACNEAVVEEPNLPDFLEGRASSRIQYANTLRVIGRETEESGAYKSAMDDYELLLKALPGVPVYRENLALTRTDLTQILHGSGRNQEAKAELLSALEEFTDLFRMLPSIPRYHEERAVTLSTLGIVLMELDELGDSEISLQSALKLYEGLIKGFPEVPGYHAGRGTSRSALARVLIRKGQGAAAKELFREAVDDFQEARRGSPDNIHDRDNLASCLTNYGHLLWDLNERQEASRLYREAIMLRETLVTEPQHICRLADLLSNCPDEELRAPARAVQLAERATKLAPQNPATWYALAVAQFRSGVWDASRTALEKALALRTGDHSADSFWLAMIRQRSGDEAGAKAAFEQAQAEMKTQRPGAPDLIRLKAEAAKLLGIEP